MFHKQVFKALAIILCCCYFSITPCCEAVNIDQFINELPQHDREGLNVLFRHLMGVSDFGYTLFGKKPVSLDAWSNKPSLAHLFFPMLHDQTILRNGWPLWKKYRHLFKGQTFLLRESTHFGDFAIAIYLINRVEAKKIISRHLETFRKHLGPRATTQEILALLEDDQSVLDQTLAGKEELLGLLLGFGAANSQAFQRFTELNAIKKRKPIFPNQLVVTDIDDPEMRYLQRLNWDTETPREKSTSVEMKPEMIERELNAMKWGRFGKRDDPLVQISLPTFRQLAGDPETKQLMQTYEETRPKIIAALNSPNFLKIVLTEISK